jgi:hypothetical protein
MRPSSSTVTIRPKNWLGAKLVIKDATKKHFANGIKKTCEIMKPVR